MLAIKETFVPVTIGDHDFVVNVLDGEFPVVASVPYDGILVPKGLCGENILVLRIGPTVMVMVLDEAADMKFGASFKEEGYNPDSDLAKAAGNHVKLLFGKREPIWSNTKPEYREPDAELFSSISTSFFSAGRVSKLTPYVN